MREKEVKREKGDAKTKTERENKGILRHIKRHESMLSLNPTDFTRPENGRENRKLEKTVKHRKTLTIIEFD